MNFQRKFVTPVLLLLLLFTEACNKKKPVLLPQAQAPTTVAEVLPDEIPEKPESPIADVAPTPTAPPPAKTKPKKPARTQTARKTTPPASSPAAPPPSAASSSAANNNQQRWQRCTRPTIPRPTVGPDMAIVAAIPSQQATQQKEETAHMVDATENA